MYLTFKDLLILLPPILLLEGLFAGSEIALLSADKFLLRKKARKGSKGAAKALELTASPEKVLSTTLLMSNLCAISITALIAIYLYSIFHGDAELITVLITSPIIVIFGELIPKTIFQHYSSTLAPIISYPLSFAYKLFFPITRLLSIYTMRLSKVTGPLEQLLTGKTQATREELKKLLAYNRKESELNPIEKGMIRRILSFKDIEAKNANIPLVQVKAIEDIETIKDAIEGFIEHRHSRMPVYSERIDNIVGILYAYDLFAVENINQPVKNLMKPTHFSTEVQNLENVMLDMHQDNLPLSVVVDEYGGAVGILTFEDIVEEIVGEISDEQENNLPLFRILTENHWNILAKIEIKELNDSLPIEIPEGEYETLGGFLLHQFGRIPEIGDELYFSTKKGDFKFAVRRATEKKIRMVSVKKIEPN